MFVSAFYRGVNWEAVQDVHVGGKIWNKKRAQVRIFWALEARWANFFLYPGELEVHGGGREAGDYIILWELWTVGCNLLSHSPDFLLTLGSGNTSLSRRLTCLKLAANYWDFSSLSALRPQLLRTFSLENRTLCVDHFLNVITAQTTSCVSLRTHSLFIFIRPLAWWFR